MIPSTVLILASFFGFLSVLLGAFGAHALKGRFDEYSMGVFQTGVHYQTTHALALLALAVLFLVKPETLAMRGAQGAIYAFTVGIFLFSGSLYALAFTGVKALGAVTPFGGVCFLAGWICTFILALQFRNAP